MGTGPDRRELPKLASEGRIIGVGKFTQRLATEMGIGKVLGASGPDVLEGLSELKIYLRDHEDREAILLGLVRAVVTEEVSRQTVTKQPMIIGVLSEIDKDAVVSRWKCLSEHYSGSKHAQHFIEGVERLSGLTSDAASVVIHQIRRHVAPTIDWAMETSVIQPSVKLPGGRFVFDGIRVKGPRVALWKFRNRMARLVTKSILWFAAVSATVHWILWVMFDEPYLLQRAPGVGKTVQLILICCTTLIVWSLVRSRSSSPPVDKSRVINRTVALACWGLVAGGWTHWILWVVFKVPDALGAAEPFVKMGQVLFLLGGVAAALLWSRRTMDPENGDGSIGSTGEPEGRAE